MIKQIKPVILFLISVFTLLLAYGNQVYAVDRFQGWQDKNTTVRGTVTDSEGQPLIGATVNVVGTKTVEVTDLDGNFNISAPIKSVLENGLSHLWVSVSISDGAVVEPLDSSPVLGNPGDYSSDRKYRVIAADGSSQDYIIQTIKGF